MELLDRYLQAVKKLLPLRRQDDIIAELRANMESQIEDKESVLGRTLTEGEFEDFLRKMGPPVVVASRYRPQHYLIGPTLFPLYSYVLRVALLWAFIVCIVAFAVVVPLATKEPDHVFGSLFSIPGILIQVAGWITLVFAVFEFTSIRYPQMCPAIEGITKPWHPQSLPPVDKDTSRLGKPRSFAQAVAEICLGAAFLAWLLLIPKHPFVILGPGAVFLRVGPFALAPVWWTVFWCTVASSIVQIVWKCIDLARGTWQFPNRIQHVVFKLLGATPLIVLLTARDSMYVVLRNPGTDQLRDGQALDQTNNGIHYGAAVICTIIFLELAFDVWKWAREAYGKREESR